MPTVALIGKPNTGKSTIFNRMIKERVAITEDRPGVTRDRIYAETSWLGQNFFLIDTGGIEIKDADFQEQIQAQALIAIEEADVIVFVGDGKSGVDNDDEFIASLIRKTKKDIIVAVNKIDDGIHIEKIYEFYSLGLGDPIAVSAEHGIGFGDLLDLIVEKIPKKEEEIETGAIKFSIIGRPNVGKSSLANSILNEKRSIVSPISGTTRDAINTNFSIDDQEYTVIDTAGLKKRGKIIDSIEKYAMIRTLNAISKSDICLIVLDAFDEIVEQDKKIAGLAFEANKGVIIVVNKWDLIKKDTITKNEFEEKIRKEFKFLFFAPIVFVSAVNKIGIESIIQKINVVNNNLYQRFSTSVINKVILDAVYLNKPSKHNNGELKINYATQVETNPPYFVIFVNRVRYLHFSYERYLKNKIRESFDFEGVPIKIKYKEKQV